MHENNCTACGYVNREENIFCTKCGEKLIDDHYKGPRLLVLGTKKNSIIFRIQKGRSTIGRDIANALIINDELISKFHAALTFENETITIEDLESKNGVFVSGKKIFDVTTLTNGCLIKLGSTILKYENNEA